MDELEFRIQLNELSMAYPDLLQEYDNDYTWVENKVISFKNRYPESWNTRAARTEFTIIKTTLQDGHIA